MWLIMHRDSEDEDRETAALRLYMDESGGDNPSTPHAVIGGILIFKKAFLLFEEAWDRMLLDHGIPDGGIHMKEFGPHGRLGKISKCCREKLFSEARYLIEHYKAMTIVATIDNSQYSQFIPAEAREKFSLYGMCFHLAVMMNHRLCEANKYSERVPFIMDAGNPYASHVRSSHEFIVKRYQKHLYLHAGGLFFDDDAVFGVLQAADLIAWCARRELHNLPFPPGFGPLEGISKNHARADYSPDLLRQLGESLQGIIDEGENLRDITDEDIRKHA